MTWLTKSVAVLLLALWVPVTMHCELETTSGFTFLQCCCGTDTAADTDCGDNACSSIEAGLCKVEDDGSVAVYPPLSSAFLAGSDPVSIHASLIQLLPSEPEPPPELASSWQFHYRVALSPRAPCRTA